MCMNYNIYFFHQMLPGTFCLRFINDLLIDFISIFKGVVKGIYSFFPMLLLIQFKSICTYVSFILKRLTQTSRAVSPFLSNLYLYL